FRDYIGMPKPNMYQSLHTSVVGPQGQRMEVQIRTREMHRIAEEGIAAHWCYKESGAGDEAEQQRFTWLRRLLEWQRDTEDPTEFMHSLRMDLYPEEIFVFTPTGEVKELPRGATPVDFAYAIHTEVGHRCVGAKVNGRMVSLRTELKTGDQVEVLTSPNHSPSKDWLGFVVTSRARSKVRAHIRQEERDRALALGRDLLERELRRHQLTLNSAQKQGKLEPVMKDLSFSDVEALILAVAYGKLSARQVVNRLLPRPAAPPKPESFWGRSLRRLRKKPSSGIKVKGVDEVMVRVAKCCSPLPGEPVVGYITRGRGVTVHAKGCPALDQVEPERRVEVEWEAAEGQVRPVAIRVVSNDRTGQLADLSQVLKQRKINILEAEVKTTENFQGVATFMVEVADSQELDHLLKEFRKVKGVVSVSRQGVNAGKLPGR
ncbi:MAG: TGS domain-containing protein, partial [Deltaproteobacteria bacterium]|nr:TGS domain-containing protein [Deltaproteobacteria bacterium]